MNARANRGSGNNNVKAYQSAKVWDSVEKTKGECKHLRMKWVAGGKMCKQCGEML